MNKISSLAALLLCLIAPCVFAASNDLTCPSSGLKTSSGPITAGPGILCGVQALTDGTNNAVCTVYDYDTVIPGASGTVVGKGVTAGAGLSGGSALPVPYRNGLYLSVSGTGANCIVFYRANDSGQF